MLVARQPYRDIVPHGEVDVSYLDGCYRKTNLRLSITKKAKNKTSHLLDERSIENFIYVIFIPFSKPYHKSPKNFL